MDSVNGNILSDGQKPFKQSLYTADEFNCGSCFPELPKLPTKMNGSSDDCNLSTSFPAKAELSRELPKLPTKMNDSYGDCNLGTSFTVKVELGGELPKLATKLNDSYGDCNLGTSFPVKVELGRDLPELPTMPADSLVPLTPDCVRENGGNGYYSASPIYVLPRALCFSSRQDCNPIASNDDTPGTPKNSVFDPFAQGPDYLMLAPQCQKYNEDSQTSAARRLKFEESPSSVRCSDHNDNNGKGAICVEETLFETVYNNLLGVIVSNQNEEFLAGISNHASYSSGDRTPTSAPLLSGVVETCPAAPKKPTTKFRNIDRSLCRRLEF